MTAALEAALDERAEELYEEAPCGYLSMLPDGTIVKVNRTFLDWTGYARKQLVSRRRFAELLSVGGRIYYDTHFAPLLTMQDAVREIAVELRCADGRRLPVLVNAVLKRDADGRPLLIRTTVFDATDRRSYERELLVARDRERAARHRTELLQRVTAALATRRAVGEIAQAVAVELAAVRHVAEAEVVLLDGEHDRALVARRAGGTAVSDTATAAVIPVELGGRAFGAIVLRTPGGRPLEDDDRPLLLACARQCAQALDRAALQAQTDEVAHVLQRSLLAGMPFADPRVRLGAHYRPAVESLEVGGDWHDAFPVERGRLGVVVGDVVGRGLAAASAMGQLRSATRALAGADLGGPAEVLARLDRFAARVPLALMATLVYAELDLETGAVRFSCAGHPPPVLLAPGAPPVALWEGRSFPLGIAGAADVCPQERVTLVPGAQLLLYTDGLVERRGETLDRGVARLLEVLSDTWALEPQQLVDDVVAALAAEEQVRDDLCALCVQYAG